MTTLFQYIRPHRTLRRLCSVKSGEHAAPPGNQFQSLVLGLKLLLLAAMFVGVAACGFGSRFLGSAPTPTPTAPPTATPVPTSTLAPGETAPPTAVPTPQVVIPADYKAVADERLAYSFAVPGDWNELDLRSTQIQRLAGILGMGEQLTPLNEFLESPEGQVMGKIYITDISSAMFGGLPSLLNVSVFQAPDPSLEAIAVAVQNQIDANLGSLGGSTNVNNVAVTVVNNLPALTTDATVDLSGMGMDGQAHAKVTALLANDQIYLMTILVPAGEQTNKADELAQIIGTFRPE